MYDNEVLVSIKSREETPPCQCFTVIYDVFDHLYLFAIMYVAFYCFNCLILS